MTNRKFGLGILTIMLVFGIMVIGCGTINNKTDNETGNVPGTGGKFILNNIPAAYEGKYAILGASRGRLELLGFVSIDTISGYPNAAPISNGSVSLPMWTLARGSTTRYSGNHNVELIVSIIDSVIYSAGHNDMSQIRNMLMFESVSFSNGNATRSANDGTWVNLVQ